MKNQEFLTLNEFIKKTNQLTEAMNKYVIARKEVSKVPFIQRFFIQKSEEYLLAKAKVEYSIELFQRLWIEFDEMTIPPHIVVTHEKQIESSKHLFRVVDAHTKIFKKLMDYGKVSVWKQIKSIPKASVEIDEYLSLHKEWNEASEAFNQTLRDR